MLILACLHFVFLQRLLMSLTLLLDNTVYKEILVEKRLKQAMLSGLNVVTYSDFNI